MSSFKNAMRHCHDKTGISERMLFWIVMTFILIFFFVALFIVPVNGKINDFVAENAMTESNVKQLDLLKSLDEQLREILHETYPDLKAVRPVVFEKERLIDLPSYLEVLAGNCSVTMLSVQSASEQDGVQVSVDAVFQGDMQHLHELLIEMRQLPYIQQLDSIHIFALPDAEQMQLKFKVSVK